MGLEPTQSIQGRHASPYRLLRGRGNVGVMANDTRRIGRQVLAKQYLRPDPNRVIACDMPT